MIKVLAYSAGRSDIYRWKPFIENLKNDNKIYLKFILSDSHFDKEFGYTYKIFRKIFSNFRKKKFIKKDTASQRLSKDSLEFEKITSRDNYNFVILLGDRFEILNIAYLSTIYNIPIIHLYGGAITSGAIDNQIRNAVTKLSQFHLVACDLYKKRLIKMGERGNRIKVIGVNSLRELISKKDKFSKKEIEKKINITLGGKIAMITVHPVTLFPREGTIILKHLFKIIDQLNLTVIFTYPNKDKGNEEIINKVNTFCSKRKCKRIFIKILELELFSSILNNIDIMLGNSSSGIVESASFKLPVINIGSRQNGKMMPENVISVKNEYNKILKATKYALSIKNNDKFNKVKNPYYLSTKFNIVNFLEKIEKVKNINVKQ